MRHLRAYIFFFIAYAMGAAQTPPDKCTFENGAVPAFCDTFETIHQGGRAGDLDPTRWNFYRANGAINPPQGQFVTWQSTTVQFCQPLVDNVLPPHDSFICGQQFNEPNYWLTGLNDNGAFAWLGSRALQLFDFTNRAGTIE